MIDEDPKVIEWNTFLEVFSFKHCKSSVSKYKWMWKSAPADLCTAFLQFGDVKEGSWRLFTLALKNPNVITLPTCVIDLMEPDPAAPGPSVKVKGIVNIPVPVTKTLDLLVNLPAAATVNSFPTTATTPQSALPASHSCNTPSSPTVSPFPPLSPLLDNDTHLALQAITNYNSSDSDDGPEPNNSLCPFYDQPLPTNPSCGLIKLLNSQKNVSWSDPTLTNPSHQWTTSDR
jgi:hypothetical protein